MQLQASAFPFAGCLSVIAQFSSSGRKIPIGLSAKLSSLICSFATTGAPSGA